MAFEVQAGDVFFTKGTSLLGKLIRWAERDPGEEKSWANHVGVVVKSGVLTPYYYSPAYPLAKVVEALETVKHHYFWDHYENQRMTVEVYRHSLYDVQVDRICEYAKAQVGNKYGWWKLAFHLFDRVVFKGKKTASRLLRIDGRPICSYLVARAFSKAGVSFGGPAVSLDPDEMHDWVQNSKDWLLVGVEKINL